MALTQVTSIGLKDGEIVNADLHSAASVALSKLADSGALGSAVTATTQSASDDSTKLATTAFVQAAVTSLIDGAPGSLNTLNELAAAINDDSSYATTLTTALATKLPLAGGTLTGTLEIAANTCLIDLMETSATNHRIRNGNGNFYIQKISDDKNTTTNQLLIDGGTGEVQLFHNGNEKLNTFVNGVTVTGNLYATNAIFVDDSGDNGTSDFIGVGLGKDLKMYHNSSHSFIQNSTGTLYVKSDTISFNKLDGTNLFWSNGSEMRMYPGGNQKFTLDSNGKVDINNGTGQAHYQITQTNGNTVKFGIVSGSDIELSGSANNSMYFKTNNTEKLRIASGNTLHIGKRDGNSNSTHWGTSRVSIVGPDPIATSVSKAASYLAIGNNESELNGVYPITFGYTNNSNSHQPAYIAYKTTNAGAAEFGDLLFGTRNVTTDAEPTERLRITSGGHLLHGVTSDEDTSGNGGVRFINAGDIQIDGDQKALVFRSANSTAQVQSGIEWWNENGAGVQAKIICDRTAIQKAPSDIVFFTNTDVDTSANSSEGDVTEHFRITSVGKVQRRSLGTQTNPALSAQHLYENGITTDGNYYLQSASMTAPALVRCVFHDNRGWMILMQHQCVDCDGLYLSHLENKVGTPNHATSDFQGCAQTDGLNMTPMNMWDAFGPNAEDSRMAMYAREIQTSGGSYDETQTYSGYVGNPIFSQVTFKRLFSGNFSNGTFEYSIRVTYGNNSATVYSKKGTTWSAPSLACINNGVVDEDLYFCNGADDGDTNWSFGLMQGGTPYPRLANSANGGGRNSKTRWAIIGICEK